MAERAKPVRPSEEEIRKYGHYSPAQIANIINISLFGEPGDADAFRALIEGIHKDEQFIILLMKTINSDNTAFFENIIGICETRKYELAERKQMESE